MASSKDRERDRAPSSAAQVLEEWMQFRERMRQEEKELRERYEDEVYKQRQANRPKVEEEDQRRTDEVIRTAKPNTNPPDRSDIISWRPTDRNRRANKTTGDIHYDMLHYTPGRTTNEGMRDDGTLIGWTPVGQKVYTGRVSDRNVAENWKSGKRYYTNVNIADIDDPPRAVTRGPVRTKMGEEW